MWIDTLNNNQVVENHAAIRAARPQTSFPPNLSAATIESHGFVPVLDTAAPPFSAGQKAQQTAAEFVNGQWTRGWEVVAMTADEIAKSQTDLIESITQATQKRLDDFAKTRNYDGILSACTYAASTVPKFQTEGQYCVNVRDETWATLYQLMAEVQAGTRPVPADYAAVESLLPTLTWPA